MNDKDAQQALNLMTNNIVSRYVGVKTLWDYLCGQGFLEAPASSEVHHHNAFDGGLLAHSIRVVELLLELRTTENAVFKKYHESSLVIVGLFHDCDKACDGFGRIKYQANILKSGNRSEAKPYVKNKSILTLCGAYRALMIVSKFVPLLEDEMQAIAHHDYLFVPEGGVLKGNVEDVAPLTLMLHFADMWAGIYEESPGSPLKKERNKRYFLE